ncbi:MAG: glycine cleavage T C-terminal barrel domain-containing protein, partial [bacterium]
GGYAHFCNKSVAIGFLPVEMISSGAVVQIEILGERRDAVLIEQVLFDPKAERMRS